MIKKLFCEHPRKTGETYLQHLAVTLRITGELFLIGAALVVHGVFPFLFGTTASERIARLYECLAARAKKHQPQG